MEQILTYSKDILPYHSKLNKLTISQYLDFLQTLSLGKNLGFLKL